MENAKLYSLKTKDAIKGFILSIISAILTAIYGWISNESFPTLWTEWKTIIMVGVGAGIAYIIKNLLTSSEDKFLAPEPGKKNIFSK